MVWYLLLTGGRGVADRTRALPAPAPAVTHAAEPDAIDPVGGDLPDPARLVALARGVDLVDVPDQALERRPEVGQDARAVGAGARVAAQLVFVVRGLRTVQPGGGRGGGEGG